MAAKSSALTEAFAGSGRLGLGAGWEEGVRNGPPGRPAAPRTPRPDSAPRGENLAAAALQLRRAAAGALPAGLPVAVRVTAAAVRWSSGKTPDRRAAARAGDSHGTAIVAAATLLVGADPSAPAWSRTARLDPGDPPQGLGKDAAWPAGWLEALARESAVAPPEAGRAWDECTPPEFAAPRGALVVDVFAAGDLLRLEALRSARAGRGGGNVPGGLARGVRVLDHRAPRGTPGGSWRTASDPPWEELALEVARQTDWPEDGFALTRLVPLRGVLLGAGHLLRDGEPTARWGPVVIPPPAWWISRIVAALGDPVSDATGLPVVCPPLRVAWGRGSRPR